MRAFTFILGVLAATQLGATDCGQITRDQGFDLWCGDVLCTWKLERGEIKRVGTWNEHDAGVEMVGDDVAFAQLTPVDSNDTTCIRFELVANVDENAEVTLNADVYGDGSVEYSERIPTSKWKPLSFKIPVRAPYNGVRFELTKKGVGKAVLAQLQAETANGECDGLTPIIPGPAPLGGECATNDQCASGMCAGLFGAICVGCQGANGGCTGTDVCGLEEPASRVLYQSSACVARNSKLTGERCNGNAECASSSCSGGVCSDCSSCTSNCFASFDHGPSVCNPGQHHSGPGVACGADADCASGHCAGAELKQCLDGRPCDSPEQCPVIDGLAPSECDSVGIEGGRCD